MKHSFSAILMLAAAGAAHAGDMSNSIEYTQLYIIGDAVESSWNLGAAPELTRIDNGVFEWTGRLAGGKDFKFMNTREAWHKHVVNTTGKPDVEPGGTYKLNFFANWTLPGENDLKFRVAADGRYVITVDLNSMMMKIDEAPAETVWPERFFLTGSATGDKAVEIPACHGVEYKTTVRLEAGRLMISDGQEAMFVPRFADVDISYSADSHAPMYPARGAEAEGWSVTIPGDYSVYIDAATHRYMARPLRLYPMLYIVGGCCERAWNYWDSSDCIFLPDPSDPELMVWQGELRIGGDRSNGMPDEPDKFKILSAQSWFSPTFHPYEADAPACGTSDARISGGDDLKWTIDRDGIYRLVLDLRHETLTGTLVEELQPAGTGGSGGETASVNDTGAASSACRYYNLQGIPVDKPSGGVYIEANHDKVSKVFIQ